MDNINQNQIRGDDDLSDTMQDQPANVIHTNNSNFRAEGGMSSESSSQRGDYDYDTNRDLVNADQVKSPGRPDFRYGDNDKDALDQIFLYDGFAKNKQAWGFFNNQTFNAEALDFDEEEFYGENWKTLLIKRMSAQFGEIDKMQRVEAVDTYEPKLVSLEISQLVEEERENFIQKQKESDGDLNIFKLIEDKGFEKFKELFGTVENEEGELQNSFKRFIHPAFDVKQCSKHRNSIEVFSYNQCYFIVSKSFSHKIGNTRLQMRIWKMTPGNDEEEASVERLHKVDWPIVDKNACFDPSMISVIQWEKNLYYFKVINQIGDTASKVDIIFQMYRYDLVEEEESLVREFNYNWKAAAADHEELLSPAALSQKVEEEGQAEAEGQGDGGLTLAQQVQSPAVGKSSVVNVNEKHTAYAAIFMKVDSNVCETEEDFVNRRMLALVFDSGIGGADQNFIFKIRRLANFQQDLYFNKVPIPCNEHFKFQFFPEESVLKRQAFALIYTEKMMVVPINLSENQEVHYKEFYHYNDVECKCCNDNKKKIAEHLKDEYLQNFKVLESYNYGYGEEYRSIIIKKQELAAEMIKYLEKDEQMKINLEKDCMQIIFDKRFHKYIFIFNVQHEGYKDDLMVYESTKVNNVRNTLQYDPELLHPMIKYIYHYRTDFLRQHEIKDNGYLIQKQLFPLYNNVIAELRRDKDNMNHMMIVAYESLPDEEGKKKMHLSVDDAQIFMNCFHGINTEYQIQFLQLARDDRTILPRVIKDLDKQQIIFQLFQYKDKMEDVEEHVEDDEAVPEDEEEDEDEKLIQMRRKKEAERRRVVLEIPLDLSTTSMKMEDAEVFIQPSTSVYKQNFGQENNHYVQDFQVCVYVRGHQMCRIFTFRCYWNPKRRKDEPDPYEVYANLVGLKMLIFRPIESREPIGFFPIYDEFMQIQGTQMIVYKKWIVNMPNFERDEWMFTTEVAMSGYKIYFNQETLDEDCLLLQANLAEVLNARPEFTESDHSMLLKYQIRFLMNMVPFMLEQYMMSDLNYSNFLQPMELLNGQSCCDIMLHDPAYLQNVLKKVQTDERQVQSVFEFFIKELNDEERDALFAEDYYIPRMVEVSRDSVSSNPLLRCFESEPIFYGSLERILAYMFSRPYAKNQSMIFMEIMPLMLNQPQPSNQFANFFIDSPNAELNFNKIGSRFTVILQHPDLPQYTNQRITLIEFEDELSVGTQTDVQKWMTTFIIEQGASKKNSQIPVRHYYVDFRIQNLGKKLNQFKRGESIDTNTISDFEVSQQLLKICTIYGKDIEFQDGTRNIIDDMFEKTKYIYSIQLMLFLVGYAFPLFMSLFVVEYAHYQVAMNIISMMTVILFVLYDFIQLIVQRKDFFRQVGFLNDILLFIIFFTYIGVRFRDSRSYLPEVVSWDGDLETQDDAFADEEVAAGDAAEGARRLAKGGGGGGGAGGSGGAGKGGIYGDSGPEATIFTSSFLAGFLDFTERKIWKVAFLGFLHTMLLITGTLKFILFIKIYSSFQELILILQDCIRKVIPFTFLIYFWVLMIACMFRILGADNGDEEELQAKYKLFGPFFYYTMNTYRQAIGDPQVIDNAFWVEANENGHTEAARFMTGMIWLMWLLNQYFVLIFSFNFMVSIIGQGYEESLDQVTVQKYTFRCERVMEASILTKMAGAARTLQTFSLSTNNNASIGDWPGFVQSIKTYVREENIVIRQSLTDNVVELHKKIDSKTLSLENQIKDLSKKMTHVNDGITEKLDNLAERFGEIKDALAVSEEGSNFMGEVEDVDGEGAGDQDGGIKLNDIDISQAN